MRASLVVVAAAILVTLLAGPGTVITTVAMCTMLVFVLVAIGAALVERLSQFRTNKSARDDEV